MADFLHTYSKEIISIIAVLLAFILNRAFRLKPRLIHSVRHESFYKLKPHVDNDGNVINPNPYVRTVSIFSQNVGLLSAKNVEYTFNWRPEVFTISPGRNYDTTTTEEGRWVVKLDSLAPGETFVIELLSVSNELPLLSSLRCEDSTSSLIATMPQRVFSPLFNWLVVTLMILGMITVAYFVVSIAEVFLLQP